MIEINNNNKHIHNWMDRHNELGHPGRATIEDDFTYEVKHESLTCYCNACRYKAIMVACRCGWFDERTYHDYLKKHEGNYTVVN